MRVLMVWIMAVLMAFGCVYESKLPKMEESNKLLWVFVQLPNCPWCHKMHYDIVESGFYDKNISPMYALEVLSKEEAKECGLKAQIFPTSFIVDPRTNEALEMFPGYVKPDDFLELLTIVYEQSGLRAQPLEQ
jgi:thioredoxin-related protein